MDKHRWEAFAPTLWAYVALLEALLDGRVTAPEFEVIFLSMYKHDPTAWHPGVFNALECVFGAVDEYCEDAELRSRVNGLSEADLTTEVQRALASLHELREEEDRFAM